MAVISMTRQLASEALLTTSLAVLAATKLNGSDGRTWVALSVAQDAKR